MATSPCPHLPGPSGALAPRASCNPSAHKHTEGSGPCLEPGGLAPTPGRGNMSALRGLLSPSECGRVALPARPACAPASFPPWVGGRGKRERPWELELPAPCAPAGPTPSWRGSARALGRCDPCSRCCTLPSPAGSSLSSESSPVSSPATNHSSPASTPKRVPMGPIIVPPGGHSVPSTPPVVTIAPTKTVNGVWRSESRQVSTRARGGSRRCKKDAAWGWGSPGGSSCWEEIRGCRSGGHNRAADQGLP